MNEPIPEQLTPPTSEPGWALVAGGSLGAICFFLFALLFGATWAIATIAIAIVVSLVRGRRRTAIVFFAAGLSAALGHAPSTTALFISSLVFGAGLALVARDVVRAPSRGLSSVP